MAAINNPDLDPARLREFLEIGRELENERRKQEFGQAFAAAYRVISKIKILKNGAIVYEAKPGKAAPAPIKFIKHEDLSRVIKPVLAEHNLTATYSSEYIASPAKTIMVMEIIHDNGYSKFWRSVPFPMVDSGGGKSEAQGAASSGTYGRRYVIIPAFDIVAEDADDDGSGKGVAEYITQDEAQKITDILEEAENRKAGQRNRAMGWIQKQFRVQLISELHQGEQLGQVMKELDAMQVRLGMK